jgi:uncharacterized membrane protein YqiK
LEADDLAAVRIRAEAAGLNLDDTRLAMLAELLQEFMEMMSAIDRIEIDPSDLALELFDPAWSKGERAR